MSLRLAHVQVDVPPDVHDATVAFWVGALGADGSRPGVGPFTHLVRPRSLLGLHLQMLGDGPARVHLDLEADDPAAEVARLLAAGAEHVGTGECEVVRAPGGHVLCVCTDVPSGELEADARGLARLHVLVIDVAQEQVEQAAAFWATALGVEAEHLLPPYEAYWRLDGVSVQGGPMRVLVQDVGPGAAPRIHLDLHVADADTRDVEVRRMVDLGATVLSEGEFRWTVLRDPAGNVLCVVPDA